MVYYYYFFILSAFFLNHSNFMTLFLLSSTLFLDGYLSLLLIDIMKAVITSQFINWCNSVASLLPICCFSFLFSFGRQVFPSSCHFTFWRWAPLRLNCFFFCWEIPTYIFHLQEDVLRESNFFFLIEFLHQRSAWAIQILI